MIKEFSTGNETAINALIKNVFDEFVGYAYSKEGNSIFYDFIEPRKILERNNNGNLVLISEENGTINGVIEIRDNNHICLFFVNMNYHNRGIGRQLLQAALGKIKGKTNFLEVNASPYSEKIYARLGFRKLGDCKEINGIRFVPMKMML